VWSLCGLAIVAQNETPRVESIDVYGSGSFDSARLRAELEPELLQYAALGIQAQTNPNAAMQRLEAEAVAIQEKVRAALSASGPLAYFELSMTTDFGPPQRVHAEQRANALFVLAHTNDARRLLPVLANAIYDPASVVRNNAMRVLMQMAQTHPELEFPVRDLVAAFDFPASSDRNKAGYTLAALAGQPRYRAAIREAVPVALRVLRSEKPNNHDPAYQILTQISGETFGERDYAAWERWAAEAR
jgi:HEAT repeat protein